MERDMKIGFIGLGIMGRPMALNLKAAGHDLVVPERRSLTQEIRAAATVVGDAAHVAEQADVIIVMVPDTPDVEGVLFGHHGVAEGLAKGKLVIDMSSISPIATKDYAARINALGCEYLDAPVSGGEVGAKNAALTIMVGGPESAFQRALPLFEAMGKNITHVGVENGAGQTCKVCNQIIVALNIQAVSEALTFARKAGADPARVRQALMGGFASSRILEVHAERMINRTFAPGFRIKLHQKDLNLALSSAKEMGMALPNTAVAQQMFSVVTAAGGAELDHSAMVQAIEIMSALKVDG
jgi:2-hydroxy-3-oxopropionate reductase